MLVGRTRRGELKKDLSSQNSDVLKYHSGEMSFEKIID